jgi:6,7-dimethyl-8-ribityllumazine synthase
MKVIDGGGSAGTMRFGVIQSHFNEAVTKRLLDGALEALHAGGAKDDAIDVVSVPGAFEIPLIAAQLAKTRRYDALVCLGAVIRGETSHFEYISAAVSQGIARVAYDYGVPVIFGVLTTDTEAQAEARSGGTPQEDSAVRCNRGYEAACAAIEMANLMKRLPRERRSSRRGQKRLRRNRPPRGML